MNHPQSNPELALARRLAENTGVNIFLTGKAGTGKTTFLRNLQTSSNKRIVVAAPTGIAAINARGVTLHSLFQLEFGPFIPGARRVTADKFSQKKLSLIRSMDMLVIDEISMVRADLLDYVDDVLRRHRNPARPFGGVQLLLIGDLQQLPPVVKDSEWELLRGLYATPYFFSSRALAQAGYITVELQTVYRQQDSRFLDMLNAIRSGRSLSGVLQALNQRCRPGFTPPASQHWVYLTTHNAQAASINDARMNSLPGRRFTSVANIEGNFPESAYPAAEDLHLKVGAQVMFIKNDTSEQKTYYNGMLGTVESISEDGIFVTTEKGERVKATPQTWSNVKYEMDGEGNLREKVEGTFEQIPLRPAWAITIHKSQGLTFERVIIDASLAFAHGQAYVALSRCKSLEGVVLASPLSEGSIISDPAVEQFLAGGRLSRPDGEQIAGMETEYAATVLDSLFVPETVMRSFASLHRVGEEALRSNYPRLMQRYAEMWRDLQGLYNTGMAFASQYRALLRDMDEDKLNERLEKAATYYMGIWAKLGELMDDTPEEIDNRRLKERLGKARTAVADEVQLHISLCHWLIDNRFSVSGFQKKRAVVLVELGNRKGGKSKSSSKKKQASSVPTDVTNVDLFNALVAWRRHKAKEENLPAYRFFSTKALMSIADKCPYTLAELKECYGVGPQKVQAYGQEILEIIEEYH